jgi:predicted O-methyltransferase YrrM
MTTPYRVIRNSLRSATYRIAPRFIIDKYLHHNMIRERRRLRQLRDLDPDSSALIDALWRSHFFRPLQKQSEILRLLKIVRSRRPGAICEIGAAGCGTTFLLAREAANDATIVTLDLAFTASRRAALSCFALAEQKLFCLQEDSHHPVTVRRLTDCLEGKELDLLYLDGDHSYEGIKADFELYSPFVKRGGMIVFHDIVPDFKTRYGIETSSYVGGVPRFWKELKVAYETVEELIEDPEQDGYGLGIIYWRTGIANPDTVQHRGSEIKQ